MLSEIIGGVWNKQRQVLILIVMEHALGDQKKSY